MLCKDNANREQNNKLAWLFCRDAAYLMQRYNIFFDTPNFYSAFSSICGKKQRQDDSDLSTSRFLSFDKSICSYRQVDSKELQDASEVDLRSRCPLCPLCPHCFINIYICIIIFFLLFLFIYFKNVVFLMANVGKRGRIMCFGL